MRLEERMGDDWNDLGWMEREIKRVEIGCVEWERVGGNYRVIRRRGERERGAKGQRPQQVSHERDSTRSPVESSSRN